MGGTPFHLGLFHGRYAVRRAGLVELRAGRRHTVIGGPLRDRHFVDERRRRPVLPPRRVAPGNLIDVQHLDLGLEALGYAHGRIEGIPGVWQTTEGHEYGTEYRFHQTPLPAGPVMTGGCCREKY